MEVLFVEPEADVKAEVDRCPSCGSIFLDYFDGEPGAVARAIERAGHAKPGLAPAGVSCPACREPLAPLPYLANGPEVLRCGGCGGCFLTPAQLGAVADFRVDRERPTSGIAALVAKVWALIGG